MEIIIMGLIILALLFRVGKLSNTCNFLREEVRRQQTFRQRAEEETDIAQDRFVEIEDALNRVLSDGAGKVVDWRTVRAPVVARARMHRRGR